jgi:hypothetical protein
LGEIDGDFHQFQEKEMLPIDEELSSVSSRAQSFMFTRFTIKLNYNIFKIRAKGGETFIPYFVAPGQAKDNKCSRHSVYIPNIVMDCKSVKSQQSDVKYYTYKCLFGATHLVLAKMSKRS